MNKIEKDIADLKAAFAQTSSRQLALSALARALVMRLPLEALACVLEEYEAEVDHQAAQLPPKYQRPAHWNEWSALIEERMQALRKARDQPTFGASPPR